MKKLSSLLLLALAALFIQCAKDSPTTVPPVVKPPVVINPIDGSTVFTNSQEDCTALKLIKLKDLADFPIAFAYGTSQRNTTNDKNVSDNSDRVTLQLFYTSQIWKGLNETTKEVLMDYINTDKEIVYAKSKNLKVFGHCLIYPLLTETKGPNNTTIFIDSPFTTPQFLLNYADIEKSPNVTIDDLKIVLQNYLKDVLTKYKDEVDGFDLVNELLGYDGLGKAQDTWLRKRFDTDTQMYNFVADLFVYAKSVAPNVKFFYNENGQENPLNNFAKGNKTIEIVNIIKAKNGIDGYGLQMHTDINRNMSDIETSIKTAVKTGLLIHISELDVWVGANPTAETLEKQRVKYRQIVEAYKRLVPEAQQYGITMWDTNDTQSWKSLESPTLFDKSGVRKLAFYGFAEGAGAKVSKTTTENGTGKIYTNATTCK